MLNDGRTVEILKNGNWVEIPFNGLKDGDQFRLLDYGKVFINAKGRSRFIANGIPYKNKDGIMTINILGG